MKRQLVFYLVFLAGLLGCAKEEPPRVGMESGILSFPSKGIEARLHWAEGPSLGVDNVLEVRFHAPGGDVVRLRDSSFQVSVRMACCGTPARYTLVEDKGAWILKNLALNDMGEWKIFVVLLPEKETAHVSVSVR